MPTNNRKAIEAFLLKSLGELIEGHSLMFLFKRASLFDINVKSFLKDCAYINQFYIETRYPSDIPMVMVKDEAEECIIITQSIFKYIMENHLSR